MGNDVVVTESESDTEEVAEAVSDTAEAVAEAVSDTAEVVAEAVAEATETTNDFEHRLTLVEERLNTHEHMGPSYEDVNRIVDERVTGMVEYAAAVAAATAEEVAEEVVEETADEIGDGGDEITIVEPDVQEGDLAPRRGFLGRIF